jgi:hypothetical protein
MQPEPLSERDFFDLTPETVPFERVVPNHKATVDSDTPIEEPPKRSPLRDRILKGSSDKPRDTRAKPAKKSVPNVPGQFVEPLTDFYNGAAMLLMPFKPAVSMAIIGPARTPTQEELEQSADIPSVAENCARAWDEAAQRSESVRRMIDGFLTVGVWGALIAAHVPILVAVAGDNPKFNPAAAMEAMLRKQQEAGTDQ